MNEENIQVRYNTLDVSSIKSFCMINSGCSGNIKDVYFLRFKGIYAELKDDIEYMDKQMLSYMNQGLICYDRINSLDLLNNTEKIDYYSRSFQNWKQGNCKEISIKASIENILLRKVISDACKNVLCELKKTDGVMNESIEKNFVIKLLFWTDLVFEKANINWEIKRNIKIVATNVNKKHEYLFYYFLTRIGINVLLIQNSIDIPDNLRMLNLSKERNFGNFEEIDIKPFNRNVNQSIDKNVKIQTSVSSNNSAPVKISMSAFRRPDRDNTQINNSNNIQTTSSRIESLSISRAREEMSFEELANLASSVVMIAIHNKKGEVIGTGSGIMIAKNGYILTNNHVASGGYFYSVRIEEDENIYETNEVIKYNPMLDLALIRINRQLNPLKVYDGKNKLVRGQKVVAIGSPLGLFNSVSDGIISGFRVFNEVDMIQFTAPISNGSSGGAVLNMFGEVIGISTAGIDSGQNINLAMGYECINNFIRGFINY